MISFFSMTISFFTISFFTSGTYGLRKAGLWYPGCCS